MTGAGIPRTELSEFLRIAQETCAEAGQTLRLARHSGNVAVAAKAGFELVTNLDVAIDRLFRQRIGDAFPGHVILSEEVPRGQEANGRFCWIIDPLDGTSNFANGLPHVAISAALAIDGAVRLGVVEAPFYDEAFHAVSGEGAFLNGNPIAVSAISDPSKALIATGFPHNRENLDAVVDRLKPMLREFGDIRRLAAPALDICWVANGRLAGFIDRIFVWDYAAAGLIAEEAGATTQALDVEGSLEERDYLAAAPGIYSELLAAKLNGR